MSIVRLLSAYCIDCVSCEDLQRSFIASTTPSLSRDRGATLRSCFLDSWVLRVHSETPRPKGGASKTALNRDLLPVPVDDR